jgi:hypothetical protein
MSKFDADYNKAKSLVVDKIQAWVDEQRALKAAGQKTSSSGVKQAERAKRSIISSTDETFQYLVEEALSKDLSGEAIKNKIRTIIERQFPNSLRLLKSDRIHHKNALELVELVSQQSPEVVLQFLQRSEKEGFFFGDSLENTLGAFFTEPAHTGAYPQDSAGTINYPKEYGAPGERLISGHPAGTNDPRFKFESKIYNSGDELFDAIKPALAYSADALDRALFADKPRVDMAEMLLRNQGLIEPGESIRTIPPGPRYQAIQKFVEQPENKILIEGARQQTANVAEFIQGGETTRSNLARFQQQFPEQPISQLPLGSPELESALQLDYKGGKVTLKRAGLTGLAFAGVAALGPLGTAASAAEFAGRAQIAQETGDFADEAQAGLAGISFAGDVASYFPPAAPIGEAVSTTADVANIGIDLYREDPERAKKFAKEQISKVIPKPPVIQQVQQVQRAAQAIQRGGKTKIKAGQVHFTLPEFGLSELMGLN